MSEKTMPKMDEEQIEWCVIMLQTRMRHKQIALMFRDEFPWFADDFTEQDEFLEKFIPRLIKLVSDKRRPHAARIAEGRKNNLKSIDHIWMTHEGWRHEERQEIYDEMKALVKEMETTTDSDQIARIKNTLDGHNRLLSVLAERDRHDLNILRLEQSRKTGGHGITLPETE